MRKIFTSFAVVLLATSVWAAPKKLSSLCVNPALSPIVASQTERPFDKSQIKEVENGVKQCVESVPVFKQVKNNGQKSFESLSCREYISHRGVSSFESLVAPAAKVSALPTLQQAQLQMRYAAALASQDAYTLPASFVGQGQLLTSLDEELGEEWATSVLVRNDTAYFQQLIPFLSTQAPIVYGLVQADGSIVVPTQTIAETPQYSISFSGYTLVNQSIAAVEKTTLSFEAPYMSADAPAMAYTMRQTGSETDSYVSFYVNCLWTDAAYNPFEGANFVYTAQAFSDYEGTGISWTSALTYGESGKFTNGEAVTLSNPLFVNSTVNYTCEGVYNDGYITVAKQPVYKFNDGTYLWITGEDNGEFTNLSFKVGQDGHLLTLANEMASLVVIESAEKLDSEAEYEWYDTYTGLAFYDEEAKIYEDQLPALAFGYGESNFNGNKEWELSSYFNVATGEYIFNNLFPCSSFENWSATAVYDAATKTLTVPCGKIIASRVDKSGNPEYVILGGLDESGSNFVSKVEFKKEADGSFVATSWIGLASCTDVELNGNTFDGFYELFKPGVILTEERIERGPQTVAGADNLILNWGLQKNFYFSGLHAGMMAANADITFRNYTPVDTYNSLSWSMEEIDYDENGEVFTVAEYASNGETFKIRTSPATLYNYPTLTATNDVASASAIANATVDQDEYGIAAGVSSNYFVNRGVEPFLTRATFDSNFDAASGVAPGGTAAKNNNISNAFFYQGNPGAPFCFDGIDIVGYNFSVTNESAVITCRIRACERKYDHATASTKLTVNDTLYTSKVLAKDAFVDVTGGYGYLHFDGFYQEFEGMQMQVEAMQVNQEFLVELAWDDNNSFTFTPFSDSHINDVAAPRNTYFSTSNPGEEGSYFYWTNNAQNNVAVSFDNALFGYLDMEGSHVFELPAEGGSVDIVVSPYYCDYDEADQPITSLWLAEDSEPVTLMWEDEEYREESWVKAEIVEEHYGEEEDFTFTLRLTADALQANAPGRNLVIAFEQWGARLELEVLQGEGAVSGIGQIRVKQIPGQLYNVIGQKANAANKGVLVGRQFKAVVR